MSTNQFDPPITIDAGDNPGVLTFTCLQEIEEWAGRETEAWAQLAHAPRVPRPVQARVGEQHQAGSAIAAAAAQCFSADPATQASARTRLEKLLNHYKTYVFTHHATSWGQSILKLWSESPTQASLAMWAKSQLVTENAGSGHDWLQHGILQNHGALMVEAVVRASRGDAGDAPENSQLAALAAIQRSLTSTDSNWRETAAHARAEWKEVLAGIGQGLHAQTQQFSEQRNAAETALAELDKEMRQKIKDLEQLFGEKIRLEAPVQYWKEKVTSHDRGVWLWGIFSAAITLLPIVLAVRYAPDVYLQFEALQKGLTAGGVAILLVFAVLYLAFGRQIGRLFTTSLALRNDAAERVVMAQTFLALYQDKKLTDDERKLVLASLFRPHSAPSDSDAPAGLTDLVSKAFSPQKP